MPSALRPAALGLQAYISVKSLMAMLQVIYVTWAGVICLICTHEPEGAQCPRASADISGKSQPPVLHMLCNTSGIRKIALHYIGKDGTFDYGI